MGRKKFNMDPKKVLHIHMLSFKTISAHSIPVALKGMTFRANMNQRSTVYHVTLSFSIIPPRFKQNSHPVFSSSSPGNPVSAGERPPSANPRRHCPVPLQRRGPQQNRHRRLLRRAVRQSIYQAAGESPPYMRLMSPMSLEKGIMGWIY